MRGETDVSSRCWHFQWLHPCAFLCLCCSGQCCVCFYKWRELAVINNRLQSTRAWLVHTYHLIYEQTETQAAIKRADTMIGFTVIAYKQVLVTFLILQTAVKRCCLSWSANMNIIGERNNRCYEPSKSDIIPSKCGLPPESDIFPGNFSFCLTFNELPVDSKTKVHNSLFYQKNSYVLWLPAASVLPRSGFRESGKASLLPSPPLLGTHSPFSLMSCACVSLCVSPRPRTLIHARAGIHTDKRPSHALRPCFFFFPNQCASQIWPFPDWTPELCWQWKWTAHHVVTLVKLTCNHTQSSVFKLRLTVDSKSDSVLDSGYE